MSNKNQPSASSYNVKQIKSKSEKTITKHSQIRKCIEENKTVSAKENDEREKEPLQQEGSKIKVEIKHSCCMELLLKKLMKDNHFPNSEYSILGLVSESFMQRPAL